MRATVSEKVQVKAAGGIGTLPALLEAIDTGITRCGATATATILDDFKAQQSGQQPESRPDPTPGAY
jgi:deoxyribose-phosphate aldolase